MVPFYNGTELPVSTWLFQIEGIALVSHIQPEPSERCISHTNINLLS